MRRDDDGGTRCALCNQSLPISTNGNAYFMIQGTGDRPSDRVVLVDGREIHRCAAVPRSSRAVAHHPAA